MNNKKQIICILAFSVPLWYGCNQRNTEQKQEQVQESDPFTEVKDHAKIIFGKLPEAAEHPDRPITEAKVKLGQMLYFDKRLSKDNKQSCNTCHNLSTFGVDNKALSEGNDGTLGTRNSPTVFNAALHTAQFWDGREPDVEAQAGGPILNPIEMAMPSESAVVNRLSKIDTYDSLFKAAFPDEKPTISYEHLKQAIGAFERKLITPSRFDKYLAGNDDALSTLEKKGLQTFIKSGCPTCHSGNVLGGQLYQKFGLYGNYWEHTKSEKIDNGRFDVTKNEADKYVFKVPSLRNVEKTAPYFHDGSVSDLSEAVAIISKTQLNKTLSDEEVTQIVAFLKTLTGDIPDIYKKEEGTALKATL